MAETKFQEGNLIFRKDSGNEFREWNVGIAEEVPQVINPGGEPHVHFRYQDGQLEWRDVGRFQTAGTPYVNVGRVIVKWISAKGWNGHQLNEFLNTRDEHEAWEVVMATETGWALAKDPWGASHWLPPRTKDGNDSKYIFDRGSGMEAQHFVVAMQQIGIQIEKR